MDDQRATIAVKLPPELRDVIMEIAREVAAIGSKVDILWAERADVAAAWDAAYPPKEPAP